MRNEELRKDCLRNPFIYIRLTLHTEKIFYAYN
jgi:hypothetical protein